MKKNIYNVCIFIFLALGLVGFTDATYLTAEDVRGSVSSCMFLEGCEKVAQSKYSEIFGIPVALLGSLYYVLIFFVSISLYSKPNKKFLQLLGLFTVCGFLMSLWLVYVQLFVLFSICVYCMASAITSTLLFANGMIALVLNKKGKM